MAKDIILAIIGKIGTAGGTGHAIEYTGSAIRALSMEGRMTLCNMSIEAGARAGMVAPDETTFSYIEGRPYAPKGELFERAVTAWRQLDTDSGAAFDKTVELQAEQIAPQVTWGTNPGMVTGVDGTVPDPEQMPNENLRQATKRALEYIGLTPGTPITQIKIDIEQSSSILLYQPHLAGHTSPATPCRPPCNKKPNERCIGLQKRETK